MAENIFALARLSVIEAYGKQKQVLIDYSALKEVVASIDTRRFHRYSIPVPYPLQFDNIQDEINFHAILASLKFGCFYEPELLKRVGHTVEDTVRFGLISTHISRTRFDASFMRNITSGAIAEAFNIPMREVEEESSIPGVLVERPGPLTDLVNAYRDALNAIGNRLHTSGYDDFAQFLKHMLCDASTAQDLVSALVNAMPSVFDDKCTLGDGTVAIFNKNAQILAFDLHQRIGKKHKNFHLSDINELNAIADSDIISCLIHTGILRPYESCSTSEDKISAFCAKDTNALRIAACVACYNISDELGEGFSPINVGIYFNHLSHTSAYKDLKKYVPEKSTSI